MKGVLVVAHGSRKKENEHALEKVLEMAQQNMQGIPMKIAYLEFSAQNIPAGIDSLIREGVDEIIVVPYFLFDGETTMRIPEVLRKHEMAYPDVKIMVSGSLGVDKRIAAVLVDRAQECM